MTEQADLLATEKPAAEPTKPGRKPRQAVAVAPAQPVAQAPAGSILDVIERAARDPSVDVDKLERLIALRDRQEAAVAERAYNDALKAAQDEMPSVLRDAKNDSTNSRYARLETIANAVGPVVRRHGLSMSFGTEQSHLPNHYRITCDVAHTAGHRRSYQADVPTDITGPKGTQNKTATHAFGSAMSYGRRYLTLLILNVVLVNEDDDGRAAGIGPVIDDNQLDALMDLIESVGADRKRFMAFFKIQAMADLPSRRYDDALRMLNEFGKKRKDGDVAPPKEGAQ